MPAFAAIPILLSLAMPAGPAATTPASVATAATAAIPPQPPMPPGGEVRPGLVAMPGLPRAAEAVDAAPFEGVWTLVDASSHAFDVVLFRGGAARSNWSKGPAGARGEWGRWRVYGNGVRVDYDSGWIDLIRFGAAGFEQVSFAPDRPLAGPPSAMGRAVRTAAEVAPFVGVFELHLEQDDSPFYVAVQSNGLAFKTIPGLPSGTWTLDGGEAVIRWADGWTDAIRPVEGVRVQQRTWTPGRSVLDPPDAERIGRRLKDDLPAAMRPTGSRRPPG
jgi:hypothetical protein